MVEDAWGQLAALVLPTACPGCGRPDAPWCAGCAAELTAGARPVAPPAGAAGAVPPTWAAAPYGGAVRDLLVAWKEHGRHDLAPLLAGALAGAATAAAGAATAAPTGPRARPPVLLVPVPSSRAAVRRRGGSLVPELALAAASRGRRDGAPLAVARWGPAPLRLVRTPRDQAGLGADERAVNLRGAHRAHPRLRGQVCVVVDDITTTGATLAEAARAVGAVGGFVAGAAVVAATPRRRGAGSHPRG